MKKFTLSCAVAAFVLCSCTTQPQEETTLSGLKRADFQTTIDGKQTNLYTLKNAAGTEVCLTNLGGRIVSVMVPDKNGVMQDVVLGFDNVADYKNISNNFGATIGRYGNRIGEGKLTIDGQTYQLPQNSGTHCLHGGAQGFDTKVLDAVQTDESTIEFSGTSADGEANFPGNVQFTVTVSLTPDNAIDIKYKATTDKKTVINLTNHSYFNLSGDPSKIATDHVLYLNADSYTPIDSTVIPTGEIVAVAGTPMDFTTAKVIADDIDKTDFIQLKNGNGYDHNWVLNTAGDVTQCAARLVSPLSGIVLEVFTSEPGLQVYTGNFLDGTATGKKGIVYNQRASVCLETQHYPDSPNQPQWPSTFVDPGQTYTSECIYKFSVEK